MAGAALRRSRVWRVVTVTVLSAGAGAVYAVVSDSALQVGAVTGALIGGLLALLEVYVFGLWGAFLRLPFAAYFSLRAMAYVGVVLGVDLATLQYLGEGALNSLSRREVEFGLATSLVFNLLIGVNDLLGPGMLLAFIAGRYRRPRREMRVLLCLDLCDSTALAERLGEERFLDLLNRYYADVTGEIVAQGGEIHKYIGDEVIAVWRESADPEQPILACMRARMRLSQHAAAYRAMFGETPQFRAAVHAGPVVIGELGAQKKEIALIGDAMNTAARILQVARETGETVLISAPYFERMRQPPSGVCARHLEPVALRGKSAPLMLISLAEDRRRLAVG